MALLAMCLLGVASALLYQHKLDQNIQRIDDPFTSITGRPARAPSSAAANKAVNVLVLGSDSRISAGDPATWQAGAQRTDAIMLVHLSADRSSAQVISIPRDSWVTIPGYGEGKINAAFSFGGPTLLIHTIENLTNVRIDHFAVADFESFTKLTDAVGGVSIRIPRSTADERVQFTAGEHHMDGAEALAYTRQRHGLPNGDFDRVQRQQNWIRAILAKVNNSRENPVVVNGLLTALSKAVAVDSGLTIAEMRKLVLSARGLTTSDVAFLTAPYSGTGTSVDGQSVVYLDPDRLDPLLAAVADDTVEKYIREHRDELSMLPATVR